MYQRQCRLVQVLWAGKFSRNKFGLYILSLFLSARVDPNAVKMEREHRPGAQREAIISTLASTAAKLAENPPVSRSLSLSMVRLCMLNIEILVKK